MDLSPLAPKPLAGENPVLYQDTFSKAKSILVIIITIFNLSSFPFLSFLAPVAPCWSVSNEKQNVLSRWKL